MKKSIRALLACALFAGLQMFAADAKAGEKGEGVKLGVMWMGSSGMAKRVLKGLRSQLDAKAPKMEIDIKEELENEEAATAVYDAWQKEKDGIVFLRSSGAEYMAANPPAIPAFVGGCNNPENLGAVKDMSEPEGNITGVTYYLDASQHLKLYKQIFPKLKSVGLLAEKGHPGTPIDQKGTEAACEEMGWEYHEAVLSADDDLKVAVAELAGKVDLLVIGNEALLIDNAEAVADAAGDTPVASYAEKPVTGGHALVGLVPSDEMLGRKLGDSVVDVLVNGKKISQTPVKTDDKPKVLICAAKMKEWDVKVPLKILKLAELVK